MGNISGNTYTAATPKIYLYGTLNSSKTLGIIDGLQIYYLNGDLTVAAGVTLTITSGAEIQTPSDSLEIYINGRLNALGATFSGTYTDFRVNSGGQLDLTSCTLSGGDIHFNTGSSGQVKACLFQKTSINLYSSISP